MTVSTPKTLWTACGAGHDVGRPARRDDTPATLQRPHATGRAKMARARRPPAARGKGARPGRASGDMVLDQFVHCGTLMHGHACPPLVIGIRAGFVAMRQLEVGRALDRELFAFVELGSDHYAQGFADGVQFVTGCTFGKDLIIRLPHGKASVRLVDQVKGRAIRVSMRPEAIEHVEQSEWFRTCSATGRFGAGSDRTADPLIAEILAAPEERLFTVGPVFPLRIEHPTPSFESARCEACGESVLVAYIREADGRRLCVACEERARAKKR